MMRVHAGVTALASAAALYVLLGRARQLRWGATGREAGEPLPGDDLIADPDLTATRAITIRAPASQVWPWIVQLGQGRGGFYSYDFVENLIGCGIHSADRVVPEWQDLKPGDQVRLAPQAGLAVAHLEAARSLVLRGGVPMGKAAPPYDFTWAFVLNDEPDRATRLLVRERYAYTRPWARLLGQLRDEPEDAPWDQGPGRKHRCPSTGIRHQADGLGRNDVRVTLSGATELRMQTPPDRGPAPLG
jgi:hypothetical protein